MKKMLFLVFFVSGIIYAQETEFTFTEDKGITDFIVTTIENKSDAQIYNGVIDWIKINFKNTDKVMLTTIDNKFIRFQGSDFGLVKYFRHGSFFTFNTRYTIEISIKDGKYKFDLTDIEKYTNQYGWSETDCFISLNRNCYNNKGEFKIKEYQNHKEIPKYFNKLNISLKEKILGVEEKW
jgi:hypothetical protein